MILLPPVLDKKVENSSAGSDWGRAIITHAVEKMTLEKLAVMVQKRFEKTATKVDLNTGLASLREEINERLSRIKDDIRYIYGALDAVRQPRR